MDHSDELSSDRRRGRPVGKGRVPLSAEERRARNAQYERERRVESAEAMLLLATVLGCQNNSSNAEVLASALHLIRTKQPSEDTGELRRYNARLTQQIEELEKRLASNENSIENQPKREIRNGRVKKGGNKKVKKSARTVLRSVNREQIDLTYGNHSSEDDAPTAIKEPAEEPEAETLSTLDSITTCPMDWGIDDMIENYML